MSALRPEYSGEQSPCYVLEGGFSMGDASLKPPRLYLLV